MTVTEFITFLQQKTGRTDKDTILLAGINWVKNELGFMQLSALMKKGSVINFSSGDSYKSLPSDFGCMDSVVCVYGTGGNYYFLEEGNRESLLFEDQQGSYPKNYCIIGSNLYVGNPVCGSDTSIYPVYFQKPADYSLVDTSTPILSDVYGNEVYVFGAERYLWNSLDIAELEAKAEQRYQFEIAKIKTRDSKRRTGIIKPNGLF